MVVQAEADRVGLARPRWRDLREWLDMVEGMGELKRVNGASSEEDVGAITEMLERYEDSPCFLFARLPGFEPG
jgi:3-polyprenyl-4-hydroxybenzoate decarboxylase